MHRFYSSINRQQSTRNGLRIKLTITHPWSHFGLTKQHQDRVMPSQHLSSSPMQNVLSVLKKTPVTLSPVEHWNMCTHKSFSRVSNQRQMCVNVSFHKLSIHFNKYIYSVLYLMANLRYFILQCFHFLLLLILTASTFIARVLLYTPHVLLISDTWD